MKQLKFILGALLVVVILIFFAHLSAHGESEIDLSGKVITASPATGKDSVIDGDYCNTYWTGNNGDYWQIDLGSSMTFAADTSSFTMPGTCFGFPDLVKKQYSTNGVDWNNLTVSATPSVFSCPIAPNQCTGQRYNQVTARYLRFNPSHSCSGGQYFNLAALKLFTSGTPTPPPPTPTPSTTTSTSGTPVVSPTSSSDVPPIDCPNPPCVQNPDDPIFTPDENFNIVLEVPNGGEKWQTGNNYKIKWKYTDKENRIKSFALFLSKDGGENYRQVIIQNVARDNTEHEWPIPNDEAYATKEAKVLVAAYGDSLERPLLSDASDNNFEIYNIKSAGTKKINLPLTLLALLFLLLSGKAVLWPLALNFLLNSFMTSVLNRLAFLTAPAMGGKKGTGIAYDSYSKKPIAKAWVRIFNAENNKQLQSVITNKLGEFGFLVPTGAYYLRVSSTNYDFPSQILKNKGSQSNFTPGASDGTYSNLYFGEKIEVKKEGTADKKYSLNINIPLDKATSFNVEERVSHFFKVIGNILNKIKWPSLILGTILSIFMLWSGFSILNLVILELYLILILCEVYFLLAKNRPFGLVFEADKKPVDLAVVRFKQNKKISATSISGRDGKFTTAVNPGNYNLVAKKSGFFETEQKDIAIESSRKLEKLDITLKRSQN